MYPNKTQQESIQKNVDACRFVYNWALELKNAAYKTNGTSSSEYDLNNKLKQLKQEHHWLRAAYSQSLQQSMKRLHKAFQHFFRRAKQGDEEPGLLTAAQNLYKVIHLLDHHLMNLVGLYILWSMNREVRFTLHKNDLTESTQCRCLGVLHSGV